MKRTKNANNENDSRTKTTASTTMTVVRSNKKNESSRVNRTNMMNPGLDAGRSISEIRNQISNFPWFMEDQTRHPFLYPSPTFPIASHRMLPSSRHQLNQSSYLSDAPTTPIYIFNSSKSGIPLSHCLPYYGDPLFQRQPEGDEASSLSCRPDPFLWPSHFWVSPQRSSFMEWNGERGRHSRALERRDVWTFVQATRFGEGVSQTGYDFNDCYASSSSLLYCVPTYNSDFNQQDLAIFHDRLKPETSVHKLLSSIHQSFPPPPPIRYNLTPPFSLFVPEEDPLGNLLDMLRADLVTKRPCYFLEEIKSEPDTISSISPGHHPKDHPECISLGYLHYLSPHQRIRGYPQQTEEYDSSSSEEEISDAGYFIDVESIEE